MKQYLLNQKKSLELYTSIKGSIEPKNCYVNIFNVLLANPKVFQTGEWKIAYGYVSSIEGVYCRHCFILYGDEVIDPTVFTSERDTSNRHYYVFKVFSDAKEYLDALDEESNRPALMQHLQEADFAMQEWGAQNGYLFIG